MILYVVKSGDSIYSIASSYNISPNKIISENDLKNPESLVVGQCLIIKYNDYVHYVQPGDTLTTIATSNNIPLEELLKYNPEIKVPYILNIGQPIKLTLKSDRPNIRINGYAYEYSDKSLIEKSLPYLTYLSIFSYEINDDGSLSTIDDDGLISLAKKYNTAPMMVISNISSKGSFESELASTILNNEEIQNKYINEVLNVFVNKQYQALNVDFEYIYPQDKTAYEQFIKKLDDRLKKLGNYPLSIALAPKNSENQKGLLYEAHDYEILGKESDFVVLMTYEWGYTYGPAMPVAPVNLVKKVVDYAKTEIPSKKIFMGIPNYGYDFTLPFKEGTAAKAITNANAISYAKSKNAAIQYDEQAQTPFFTYYDDSSKEHIVYFEDPRSIKAKVLLSINSNLGGLSIWTISSYWKQMFEVIDEYYKIVKVN